MTQRASKPVYVRVAGKDLPAGAVLWDFLRQQQAAATAPPPAEGAPAPSRVAVVAVVAVVAAVAAGDPDTAGRLPARPDATSMDYAMIEPSLAVAESAPTTALLEPETGLGFAGFSAAQRGAWVAWLQTPTNPAPEAFRTLLLANLEVRRLEPKFAERAHAALLDLAAAPAWQGHAGLARTLLLSYWLQQDGAGLSAWLDQGALPQVLWPLALGHLALLGQALTSVQTHALGQAWSLAPAGHTIPAAAIALRMETLARTLGADPLATALAALGPDAAAPRPWRMHHRDLALRVPQPNLRPALEPQLADLWRFAAWEPEPEPAVELPTATEQKAAPTSEAKGRGKGKEKPGDLATAHIIVEFGHSNSPMLEFVLQQARKQPGFQQILDENRHLIYRVPYRRNELNRFWRLYDIVQNWSSTRVFANGQALEQWQVYPYSQYMR